MFSKVLYSSLYPDVIYEGFEPKNHFLKYGRQENRIKSFTFFGNTLTEKLFLSVFNLPFISHNISKIFYKKDYKLLFLSKVMIKLYTEFKIRQIFKKKHIPKNILISSWFKEGTKHAVNMYAKKLSFESTVYSFACVDHISRFSRPPMYLEVWEFGMVTMKHKILFPVQFINLINTKVNSKLKIHIHHICSIEFTLNDILNLKNFYYIYYIHDYYLLSENWILDTPSTNTFLPEIHELRQLIKAEVRKFSIWKDVFISKVDQFIAPSFYVKHIFSTLYPAIKIEVRYHPEEKNLELIQPTLRPIIDKPKILLLGNLQPHKGSNVLNEIIKNMSWLNFYHLGPVPNLDESANLTKMGAYDSAEVNSLIEELSPNLCILPFMWNETYSFTLSEIFRNRIPLISTSVGAIVERCFERPYTMLLDKNSTLESWQSAIISILNGSPILHNLTIYKYCNKYELKMSYERLCQKY
jgi:glycosyltransferase involved in cell wall biosynthesis